MVDEQEELEMNKQDSSDIQSHAKQSSVMLEEDFHSTVRRAHKKINEGRQH